MLSCKTSLKSIIHTLAMHIFICTVAHEYVNSAKELKSALDVLCLYSSIKTARLMLCGQVSNALWLPQDIHALLVLTLRIDWINLSS